MRHRVFWVVTVILALAFLTSIFEEASAVEVKVESAPIEIPFASDEGVPVAKVTINGKGPYAFIIDTGEEHLAVISPKLAAELGLPRAGTGETIDPTNNQKIVGPMFRATSLEVGGFRADNIEMFGLDAGVEGILGLPLFAAYLCEFQPAAGVIVLTKSELGSGNDRDIFDYTTPLGIPDFAMSVGGHARRVHPDAGNPGGLWIPRELTAGMEWLSPPVEIGKAGTIANTFSIFEGRLKSDLYLGKYVFKQPYVLVSEGNDHLNFGFRLFKQFQSITFDQKNHRVRFTRKNEVIELPQDRG
jgi:hypothetical protein